MASAQVIVKVMSARYLMESMKGEKTFKTVTIMEEIFKGLSENLSGGQGRFQEGNDEQYNVRSHWKASWEGEVSWGRKGLHMYIILTYN